MKRPSWDEYFIQQCDLIASRATCDRKRVGAIIVKDKRTISSGYNGSLPGLPHCDDIGHDMEDSHCVATVHGEVNAIADAARRGVSVEGATLYCNTMPCWNCFKTIVSAGITEIVFRDEYRADRKDKVIETATLIPGFVMRCLFEVIPETISEKKTCGRIKVIGKTAKKIKDTGKQVALIDPSEVAKSLGAELIDVYPQLPRDPLPRKKRK